MDFFFMDDIYFAMVVWPRTIWICSCTLENLHSFLLGFLFIFRGVFDAGLNETDANFCFDWLAKEHSYFYILEGFSFVLSFFWSSVRLVVGNFFIEVYLRIDLPFGLELFSYLAGIWVHFYWKDVSPILGDVLVDIWQFRFE